MIVADQAERLLELARARTPEDRERLLLAIADLCQTAERMGALDTEAVQQLLNDLFMTLVVEAERAIRRRLAEKIATAAWAPHALVNVLALDDIEIARPIIAASPVLRDGDLIRLLLEATIEHQIEVARRPKLHGPVVDAILSQSEPLVLTALAGNDTAEISEWGLARLVDASQRIASLRSPLARHSKLTTELAERLYAWVGHSLRTAITERFRVDPEALNTALTDATAEVFGQPLASHDPQPVERDADREDMERRLIDKLHAAGQLRPGYLLRALREDKLSLFEAALAKLGGFGIDDVKRATTCDRPEVLGLACAAVGLDRTVFPTVLALVRRLNGGLPGGESEAGERAVNAFAPHPVSAAATAFRHAVAGV